MTTSKISFRINTETYLRLEAIAAEKGLSPGVYLKKRLEQEDENLLNDIKLMQTDIKDILNILSSQNQQSEQRSQPDYLGNENILLEILMILRELASPAKLSTAQKKVNSIGLKTYNILENQS